MVKFGNIISATVSVSNTENADRTFDINAEVTANDGEVQAINKGEVRLKEDGNLIASFSMSDKRYMSVSFFRYGTEDSMTILKEVENFIENVRDADTVKLFHIDTE